MSLDFESLYAEQYDGLCTYFRKRIDDHRPKQLSFNPH